MVDFKVTRFECAPGVRIDEENAAILCAEALTERDKKPYQVREAYSGPNLYLATTSYYVEETPQPKQNEPRSTVIERILRWFGFFK